MREIKFRGQRIDNIQWVYGHYFENKNYDEHIIMERKNAGYQTSEVYPETIGQYTGMNDKNGKEIFEGDIIRTHFSFSHEVAQEPFIIQWNKDKAMFEGIKQNPEKNEYLRSFSFFPEQQFIYEVIGNIHENPELLKVK